MHSREKEKKNPQDNGDRLALIVFLTPFFGCYQFHAWHKKKWAWLNSGLFGLFFWPCHAQFTVTALKPFKLCSLLAYDGQTLEKMDCLRSVHLKKLNQPHSADNTDIITEKINMKPQCCLTWPHEILLSFLLLFPSNCYYAKKKYNVRYALCTYTGFQV